MVANAGFDNTPANKVPSAVDNIIDIVDVFPYDDALVGQECTLDPNDVADGDMEDIAQVDDAYGNDVSDTQEEVNPKQLEDTPPGYGSAANPDDQRRL